MTSSSATDERRVLVIAHIGRTDAREVARDFCRGLTKHGLATRVLAEEATELGMSAPDVEVVAADANPAADCEVVVVIGGDGTILRAAELARECGTPLLGINLGHIGFLAEAESDDVDFSIEAIVQRRYTAEERLTIDVDVYEDVDPQGAPEAGKQLVASTWALNEASIEKAARERMLEVVVEVDGRPLSRWGGDGVVCATPTGSTAYNFSAGGPIVWPGVEALLLVPLSAHALFARPLVVAPDVGAGGRGHQRATTARACCGATADAPSTCRRAPASRCAAASGRCGWSASTRRRSPTGWWRSSTCPCRAGAASRSSGCETTTTRRGDRA